MGEKQRWLHRTIREGMWAQKIYVFYRSSQLDGLVKGICIKGGSGTN